MQSWIVQYILYIVGGAFFSLCLIGLATPNRLFYLAQIPGFSPNWLSFWRLPLVWLGFGLYLYGCHLEGFLLVVFSLTLDRLDGKMATAMKERLEPIPPEPEKPRTLFLRRITDHPAVKKAKAQLQQSGVNAPLYNNHLTGWHLFVREDERGQKHQKDRRIYLDPWIFNHIRSHTWLPMFRLEPDLKAQPASLRLTYTGLGEWFDPLVDKINFLPFFAYLAFRGELYWWAVLPMILVDFAGTVIRRPFIDWPIFGWLKRMVREAKSGPFGKTKYIFQFTSLLAVMPSLAGWIPTSARPDSALVASVFLFLAFLGGCAGVFSRFIFFSIMLYRLGLKRLYRRFRSVYEHDTVTEPSTKKSGQ